jgi:K+/H+ antiporter YhaU regulatory subunit KhtT
MPEPPRRFPTPWRAEPIPGGYVVRDANGQALAYLYSRENEDKARQAKTLTNDEARRIALNIARLPELLGNRAAVEAVAGVTEKAAMAA